MEGDSDDDAQVDLMNDAKNLADLKNAFKNMSTSFPAAAASDSTNHNTLADQCETEEEVEAKAQFKNMLNNQLIHVQGVTPMNTQNAEEDNE